jgi:SPP1 family predicted phage head-tail adaptor
MSGLASRLRERVTIEEQQTADDGFGGKAVSWTALATVFAQVEPIQQNVRERSLAEQLQPVAGYRVHIRARSDIDASMRLLWKMRVLQIHSLHEQDGVMQLLTYEEQV